MPLPAVAIGTAAALEAQGLLKAGADIYLGGGPEYIKNGQPIGVIPLLGQAIARQACRRYADGVGSISPDASANYEKACRPYLEDIGYGSGPIVKSPFDGGQCPVSYRVTTSVESFPFADCSTFGPGISDQGYMGPIRGLRFAVENPSGELCTPGRNVVYLQHGPGNAETLLGGAGYGVKASIVSVVREDGQPDNCGNPDIVVDPPVPPPSPGPKFEPVIVVPIIDVDAGVTVNIDGTVEVELGDLNITIDPFGGDDDGEEEPPGGGGEDAPGTPEPGPELPGGNGGFGGDDMFGAPPAGKRWIGACIRIVATPSGAGVIPQSVPDDVYPTVVGNLRLVGAPGGSRLTDTPIQVRAKHVCVWEPVRGFNPTGVSVDLLPGYGYTYRPYAVPEDN